MDPPFSHHLKNHHRLRHRSFVLLLLCLPACGVFSSIRRTSDEIRMVAREAKETAKGANALVKYALAAAGIGILSGGIPQARSWLARRRKT